MRNHEVLEAGLLLDSRGELREPGWSRSLLQEYRRSMIKAPKFRVKEWDYYLVVNDGFAAAFTISDDGYIGLQSVSLLVFGGQPWEHTETVLNAFPMGKLHLPEDSSSGVTRYSDKRLQMSFEAKDRKRHITCHFENFMDGKALDADIVLAQPPMDTMVIATPCAQKGKSASMERFTALIPIRTLAPLIGGEEYGPTTIPGSGDQGMLMWTVIPSDGISDMVLATRARRLRISSSGTEKPISWMM